MTPETRDRDALIAQRRADKERRVLEDTRNLARDQPIREVFHSWATTQGFADRVLVTPAPGCSYTGSHLQELWETWLAATLAERNMDNAVSHNTSKEMK